jgi:hypothetical protein
LVEINTVDPEKARDRKELIDMDEGTYKGAWTPKEDDAVNELIAEHGQKEWKLLANRLHREYKFIHRSGRAVRERWINHLDPMRDNISELEGRKIL